MLHVVEQLDRQADTYGHKEYGREGTYLCLQQVLEDVLAVLVHVVEQLQGGFSVTQARRADTHRLQRHR